MPDASEQRALATRLGRVGAWSFALDSMPMADARRAAAEIESLGYGALWVGEFLAKEIFANVAVLLASTERMPVIPGIANIYARDPMAMANAGRTLAEAFPGRFVHGLGVSHEITVEKRGARYEPPVPKMRAYLQAMAKARYLGPKPAAEPPVVIAALGPKMLELAASAAYGAHTYFVPVEHTRMARERLGPAPLLAVELAFVLERDPERARAIARDYAIPYARLPNYANNLRRLGWSDADIQGPRGNGGQGPSGNDQQGPRGNGGMGPSDALLDAIVAHGAPEDVAARVRAHLHAGADHVCVQPIGADRRTSPVPALRELWPLLERI